MVLEVVPIKAPPRESAAALRVARALRECRSAVPAWSAKRIAERLAIIKRTRRLLATCAAEVAATVRRPLADTLVAEVLPLLEAMRYLERHAAGLLAPRRVRGAKPLWLFGVSAQLRREPLGVVLLVAPGNYPLFLAGAQAVQALAAGNAVCWKPAPEGVAAAAAFVRLLLQAGVPESLLRVLDVEDGPTAAAAGFDRIVLTGSAGTGVQVLQAAAANLTPTTLELSGCDAVFVLPDADLALAARCLAFGLRLNGGATCIAPRRVFCTADAAAVLEARLLELLPGVPDAKVPEATASLLAMLLAQAADRGGRVHHAGPARPALLTDARLGMALLSRDVFAPWLAIVPVADMDEALRADAACPYALGCSIFGPVRAASRFAVRVRAGSVCINDVIVPTADPRLPFGGTRRSGYGRTRGAEGLMEMTSLKTVSLRRRGLRLHLQAPREGDALRFARLIAVLHGGWRALLRLPKD